MEIIDTFKPGDRVSHVSLGNGVVISSDEPGEVHVRYQTCVGKYDEFWFATYPTWLTHRHADRA